MKGLTECVSIWLLFWADSKSSLEYSRQFLEIWATPACDTMDPWDVCQYGYITPAFSVSPWWEEIHLQRSGCGGNEPKMCEKEWKWVKPGENANVEEASKPAVK